MEEDEGGLDGRLWAGLGCGETCLVALGLLLGVVDGVAMGEGPSVVDGASRLGWAK